MTKPGYFGNNQINEISGVVTFPELSDEVSKSIRKDKRIVRNMEWKRSRSFGWTAVEPNIFHRMYYQAQIPYLQKEWSQFQDTMSKDLPIVFRINEFRYRLHGAMLKNILQEKAITLLKPGKGVIVTNLDWYREAWQIATATRGKGLQAPDFEMKHILGLITRHKSFGHIIRQELVSMIPALCLDVKYHHHVLDICAAPGSKTEQILGFFNDKGRGRYVPFTTLS